MVHTGRHPLADFTHRLEQVVETQLHDVLVAQHFRKMLQWRLGFRLDQALDRLAVFEADANALWLSDFAWSQRWFPDNLELMVVVAVEGRDDFLSSGTYLKNVFVVDLEEDGQQLLFVRYRRRELFFYEYQAFGLNGFF